MKANYSLTDHKAEIEATQKEVSDFFGGIIPDFVKEGGGILADTVRFWRWTNQVNIIKMEEEKIIQEKWSNLLANAITGQNEINPNYTEILKELSSLEVTILDKLFDATSQETD